LSGQSRAPAVGPEMGVYPRRVFLDVTRPSYATVISPDGGTLRPTHLNPRTLEESAVSPCHWSTLRRLSSGRCSKAIELRCSDAGPLALPNSLAPLIPLTYHLAMAVFRRASREPANYNDPLLDDGAWLAAGEARYDRLISNHYGSPDTIAAGGDQRLQQDDSGSALFFYQKAIDTLHSIYVCGINDSGPSSWSRQPSPRDQTILEHYLAALRNVRAVRPAAPVNASVTEVTHRLRTISSRFTVCGLDPYPYVRSLDALGEIAPDIDVSGVFWS